MNKRAASAALRRATDKFGGTEPAIDEPTKRLPIDIPRACTPGSRSPAHGTN
jgi:hypothetical protein